MNLIRNKKLINFFAPVISKLIKWIFLTCRVKVKGLEHIKNPKGKKILMLWHNRITITPQILHRYTPENNYAAFVSNSRDGEIAASIIRGFKKGKSIRVPHDMRHEALRQLIQLLKETKEIAVITPDGPRGPRYEIKAGIVLAAKKSGAAIIPMSWNANSCWRFNTWDRMILPKPFSTIEVEFGTPINLEKEDTQVSLTKLQKSLAALQVDP